MANNLLQSAQQAEARGDYASAASNYQSYLASKPAKSAEARLARIKLPILQEAVRHGLEQESATLLAALDSRAIGLTDEALDTLQTFIDQSPGSRLIDDAIFMSAYILVMDHYDFYAAVDILQGLINDYPDSAYVDTALYSIAIINEQTGAVEDAIDVLVQLRERHGSLSIAGITWAKDNYLSRFWFQRANNRIEHLQNHQENASQLVSIEPSTGNGYQHQAVIQTGGREFVVLLNESQMANSVRIVDHSGASMAPANVQSYEGKVLGYDSSWVRLSIEDNNLRGLISLPNEQLRLQPRSTSGTLADFHPLLLGDIDGNRGTEQDQVMYPPGYDINNLGANLGTIDLRNLNTNAQTDTQTIASVADRRIMASDASTSSVTQVAQLGVVVDSKFNNYFAGRGVEEALAILNATDGIFRQQIGLAINVAKVILIDDVETDPMNLGSVTMETMMRNFREYRMDNAELDANIGLATLFSGNKNSDSALGLAWIGSACRTDGFDVSVVSPYYLAELLSTHEIGHTLGAPHDTDTSCSNQTQNIMWPFLSTSTTQEFSSCSKESVQSLMASSECHVDAIDVAINIEKSSDQSFRVSATNLHGSQTAYGVQVGIETAVPLATTPTGCSASGPLTLVCQVGSLAPFQSRTIEFQLSDALTNTETLSASVTLTGALDVETHNNASEIDADGNVTMINAPSTAFAGSPTTLASDTSSYKAVSTGSINPGSILLLLFLSGLVRCRRTRYLLPR
jgi:tetratricopeptide (TPR) repeat protein